MIELGCVSGEEIKKLEVIFRRKQALIELYKSSGANDPQLRLQIMDDLSVTNRAMSNWWEETAEAHNWQYKETDRWNADFDTCIVSLSSGDNNDDIKP